LRFDRRYEAATLPLALGGVGLTLEELVRLYAALPNGGMVRPMRAIPGGAAPALPGVRLFGPAAAWYTARILEGVAPPEGVADMLRQPGRRIGFKTGTSYGYRDAWAVGFVGDYTIGVWVGRPDGTPCLACVGIKAAAPILFGIADLLPPSRTAPPAAPAGVIPGPTAELPPALRRFADPNDMGDLPMVRTQALAISFPVDGSTLRVPSGGDALAPVALRASGGVQPLRWLVNGRPLETGTRRANGAWQPDGAGFAQIQVIDADGRSASAEVFIEPAGR
jgi:penicillin-binding protein 1C